MTNDCKNCFYCRTIKERIRGIMDADPPEIYCKRDNEEFYEEWDTVECPNFVREEEDYGRD